MSSDSRRAGFLFVEIGTPLIPEKKMELDLDCFLLPLGLPGASAPMIWTLSGKLRVLALSNRPQHRRVRTSSEVSPTSVESSKPHLGLSYLFTVYL